MTAPTSTIPTEVPAPGMPSTTDLSTRQESVASSGSSHPTQEARLKHYEVLTETYRQHVDMMLRCIAIYLAIVGAAAGFIFSNPPNEMRAFVLTIFIGLVTSVSLVGCLPAFRWIRSLEVPLRRHEEALSLPAFPLAGLRDIVWMFSGLATFILGGVIVLLGGAV